MEFQKIQHIRKEYSKSSQYDERMGRELERILGNCTFIETWKRISKTQERSIFLNAIDITRNNKSIIINIYLNTYTA